MNNRSPILQTAAIKPEVIRYHLWGLAIILTVTVVGIVLLPIALPLAMVLMRRYYERLEIILTRRDLKVRRGIWNVEEKSVPLEKITDLALYQGPLMRFFGIKGMRVETAGQSSQGALVSILGIENVDDFRDSVLDQRDRISDWQENEPQADSGEVPPESGDSLGVLTEIRDSLQRIERSLSRSDHDVQ